MTTMLVEKLSGDVNQEAFIKSICSFYSNQNSLMNFFTTIIRNELNEKTKKSQPFREDTCSTQVISTYLRSSCLPILRDPLRKVIMKLILTPPDSPDSIVAYLFRFIQSLSSSVSSWPTFVFLFSVLPLPFPPPPFPSSSVNTFFQSPFFERIFEKTN